MNRVKKIAVAIVIMFIVSFSPAHADTRAQSEVNCPSDSWHGGWDGTFKGHMSFQVRNDDGNKRIWHMFYNGGNGSEEYVFKEAQGVTGEHITANAWPTKGYSAKYSNESDFTAYCVL